jgi:hypothetical protein
MAIAVLFNVIMSSPVVLNLQIGAGLGYGGAGSRGWVIEKPAL